MFLLIPFIVSIIALFVAGLFAMRGLAIPMKNPQVSQISAAIKVAAKAYLARQYRTIFIVALGILVLLMFLGFNIALGFLVGAVASALAGYIGMMVAVSTNGPTAERASGGIIPAFRLSFQSGIVTGMLVVGLGLFVITAFYWWTNDVSSLVGLAFGGSLISVFARIGGGIFTKAADVGADLVGKIEVGIPEDDPRNPGVIADNVGDNVGDCAGMAADVFETYVVSTFSAMLLGSLLFKGVDNAVLFPLMVGAVGIVASLLSLGLVLLANFASVTKNLYLAVIGAAALSLLFLYPITSWMMSDIIPYSPIRLFISVVMGILVGAAMFVVTDYYTSKQFRPVRTIAEASRSGHGTNVIAGLAIGYEATVLPTIFIAAGILLSFMLAGVYGIALAVVGMLSISGVIVTLDAFGPVGDNAGGIAEMAGLPEETRNVTDILDAAGNTTKAVTKGYAIASAGLAAVVLFVAYKEELGDSIDRAFSLEDPRVLIGLMLGGLVSYLFASLNMMAVGKVAAAVVEEVRRQFREMPGIMEGKVKPDYSRAVDIVTGRAIRAMIVPALLPIVAPIVVGMLLGAEALGGLLVGGIITGLFLALSMTSGGGAWDNAKKYIEEGNFGGKGSDAHKAAVTGDTVGDPFKDTAGPAINPMIKVMNIVALLIVKFL
ncbi:MAG: sodium-translocating pyrophosphatase [Candidatus Spechtbacteria bacterium]|nr:sodium-translocating pyrophosphatase [Candidatus Spechtbacteria bacterium]